MDLESPSSERLRTPGKAKTGCLTQTKLSAMSDLNVVPEKRDLMFSPEYMMNPLPVAASLQPARKIQVADGSCI